MLAQRGSSAVEPNPRVGAVVAAADGTILGEGWHQRYGAAHAEPNAIGQVQDAEALKNSTLYVTLEPCNHTGKTPACSQLILQSGIPRVVIGCLDPNPQVAGTSVRHLREQGVEVVLHPAPEDFFGLLWPFVVNQKLRRPWVCLKWAETANGVIGTRKGKRIRITGPQANRYVHKMRAERAAIMVGRETVLLDNPQLSVRHNTGPQPRRIIWDPALSLPRDRRVFRAEGELILLNSEKQGQEGNFRYVQFGLSESLSSILHRLYREAEVGSVLVEGGKMLLEQFLQAGLWDELYVFRSPHEARGDVRKPIVPAHVELLFREKLGEDALYFARAAELEPLLQPLKPGEFYPQAE